MARVYERDVQEARGVRPGNMRQGTLVSVGPPLSRARGDRLHGLRPPPGRGGHGLSVAVRPALRGRRGGLGLPGLPRGDGGHHGGRLCRRAGVPERAGADPGDDGRGAER